MFLNHIKNIQANIILACEKLQQKSRKNTRELINLQKGDLKPFEVPIKFIEKECLCS